MITVVRIIKSTEWMKWFDTILSEVILVPVQVPLNGIQPLTQYIKLLSHGGIPWKKIDAFVN